MLRSGSTSLDFLTIVLSSTIGFSSPSPWPSVVVCASPPSPSPWPSPPSPAAPSDLATAPGASSGFSSFLSLSSKASNLLMISSNLSSLPSSSPSSLTGGLLGGSSALDTSPPYNFSKKELDTVTVSSFTSF